MSFPFKKAFLQMLIWSLCLSAFVAIFGVLTAPWDHISLFGTFLFLFYFSLAGLCGSHFYEKKKHIWGLITIGIAVIGFLITTNTFWEILEFKTRRHQNWEMGISFFLLSFSTAQICLLSLLPKINKETNYLRTFTFWCIGLSTVLTIDHLVHFSSYHYNTYEKITIVLIILNILGTILLPILHKTKLLQKK